MKCPKCGKTMTERGHANNYELWTCQCGMNARRFFLEEEIEYAMYGAWKEQGE